MNGQSTVTDIREHLLVLLWLHGVGNEDVNQKALNKSAQKIADALHDAWWIGVTDAG